MRTVGPFLDDVRRDDRVLRLDLDALDARRRAAHRAHLLLAEPDRHALPGREEHLALAVGLPHGHDLVPLVQRDRADPASLGPRVGDQLGLLHPALAGREEDVAAGREVPHRQGGRHALALGEVQQVHEGLAARVPLGLGDLVHLEPVDLAVVREEQEVGVGRGDVDAVDDVLLLGLHAGDALAAPALAPVGLDGRPLDVPGAGDGDDHLLVGDQILEGELDRLLDDLGAALVAVLRLEGEQPRPG